MSVKRYDLESDYDHYYMEENWTGTYVKHTDYVVLEIENAQLKVDNAGLKSNEKWLLDKLAHVSILLDDAHSAIGELKDENVRHMADKTDLLVRNADLQREIDALHDDLREYEL